MSGDCGGGGSTGAGRSTTTFPRSAASRCDRGFVHTERLLGHRARHHQHLLELGDVDAHLVHPGGGGGLGLDQPRPASQRRLDLRREGVGDRKREPRWPQLQVEEPDADRPELVADALLDRIGDQAGMRR